MLQKRHVSMTDCVFVLVQDVNYGVVVDDSAFVTFSTKFVTSLH